MKLARVGVGKEKKDTQRGSEQVQEQSAVLSPAGSRKEPESRQEKRRKGRQPEGKAGDPQRNRSTCWKEGRSSPV